MNGRRPSAAASAERVRTLHPAGMQGVQIERTKYEGMRRAILRCVPRTQAGIVLAELNERVRGLLEDPPFGPAVGVTWYLMAVKQDLEARGEIEIVPGSRPQRLRRVARKQAA